MSVALTDPNRFYSREEYRRWYDSQPTGRYERVDGRIVPMGPERAGHVRVKSAVWLALRHAIAAAGVSCEALGNGITVEIGDSDYQPDALVERGPPLSNDAIAAVNPVIIVEVLSLGTASTDTGGKLAGYFQVPSVAHYLIVHATRRLITHHRRTAEGIDTRIVFEGSIEMSPPGITITVDEIYQAS